MPLNLILLAASYARAMAISYDGALAITVRTRPPAVTRSLALLFHAGEEDLNVGTIARDIVEAVDHVTGANFTRIPVSANTTPTETIG
jgi:hypothetical protein